MSAARYRVRHRTRADVSPAPAPSPEPSPSAAPASLAEPAKLVEPVENRPADYKVGYCRPPVATQFKPGETGNRNGRPKGSKNTATIVREILNKPVSVMVDGRRKKLSTKEVVFQQLAKRAVEKVDLKAIAFLLGIVGEAPSASRGGSAVGPSDVGADPNLPSAAELEILAFHQRQMLLADGYTPDTVDQLLRSMGLTAACDSSD